MSKQTLHPLTEKINIKQKAKAKLQRNDALRWLAKTFPNAFDDSTSIHPLKIGIMDDILSHADAAAAAGISKTKLRDAVIVFTRKIDYLTCLKAREMRIDLNGNPTVLVTEEEATLAAEKIKKHIDKCAKMAKQTAIEQTAPAPRSKSNAALTQDSATYSSDIDYDHRFAATQAPARTATVVIKHKANKTFDPDAVARLKEKLGLSRNIPT